MSLAALLALLGSGGAVPQGAPIETVSVPASGEPVALATPLRLGALYLLKASGAVDLGSRKVDAEFAFGADGAVDELAGIDVGIDIGVKQVNRAVHTTPTPPGPGRARWHGGFRADHVYHVLVTGSGWPLSLRLVKPPGGSGAIAVSVVPLSASSSPPGQELEVLRVPVTRTLVTSKAVTEKGKVYLLQASGAGKVGGGGTHLGDAEYMDWDEAGFGRNEGEAGADFGVGVDETEVPKMRGSVYRPRLRWWGPWRADHTYYMLFDGTGKSVELLYFDSGYKDNSPTDALTVKLFDLP